MKFIFKLISKSFYYKLKNRLTRNLVPILWPNSVLNYPFKCRRYPELTEQFLTERALHLIPKQDMKLNINSFRELIVDIDSEAIVEEVVDYYNSTLIKNRFCPTSITVEDVDYMIKNTDQYQRRVRYMKYLFVREFDIWRRDREVEELKAIKREKELKELEEFKQIGCFDTKDDIQYGFWRNTLFTRCFNRALKRYSYHKLRYATLFGQPLVIDCCFDKEMQEYEIQSVGRQMARIYQINRLQTKDAFDIHFCNCDPNSRVMKNFMKYMNPNTDPNKHYINIHSESYSQLFPNQRLIYLSPDARDIMTDFDPKAIYILGCLVGKTCRLPLTKMKAREEGIECYKLPIHRYVELNPGVKRTLSFSSCFKILSELKEHSDWEMAFINGIQDHKLKQNQ